MSEPPEPRSPTPRRGRFVSVGSKLAASTLVVLIVVTAAVYVVLSRFEREELIAAKEQAAQMSGQLFLRQASTPVIFDDPTGIKDTLALLGRDPEVLGVELWRAPARGQVGDLLASQFQRPVDRGVAPRWADRPSIDRLPDRIVFRDAVRDQDDKVVAVAAVQYSLAKENHAYLELRRRILVVAAAIAAVVALILVGASRSWIVLPLNRLLRAVRQVEAGERVDLGTIAANDEVGRLAEAFTRMADAVDRRERDIAKRNEDMRRVLDNVGQGFLVVGVDGRLAEERSAIVDRWFGVPARDQTIADYLRPVDPNTATMIEFGLEAIRDDVMPLELNLGQMPAKLRHAGQHFRSEYHPIMEGSGVGQLVLVISDVTAEVERDRAEQAQRDLMAAVSALLADRRGFAAFVREADALVKRIVGWTTSGAVSVEEVTRDLHTLKGICGLYKLAGIAAACHALETIMSVERAAPPAEDLLALGQMWDALSERVSMFTSTERQAIEVGPAEYASFARAVADGAPHEALLRELERWRREPVQPRLERLAEHARALATRLEKGPLEVVVAPTSLRLPTEPWSELWPSLVHVVRNAVDHGVEPASERRARGKAGPARLALAAGEDGGGLTISIGDDGRGIDWEALRRKAEQVGMPRATQDDLVAVMMADGISTRAEATDVSGRGVGMAAVRQVVRDLGGTIEVDSQPGNGTTFRLRFPASADRSSRVRSAG